MFTITLNLIAMIFILAAYVFILRGHGMDSNGELAQVRDNQLISKDCRLNKFVKAGTPDAL